LALPRSRWLADWMKFESLLALRTPWSWTAPWTALFTRVSEIPHLKVNARELPAALLAAAFHLSVPEP